MGAFTIVPSSLTFNKARVADAVAAPGAGQTLTFVFTNKTGSSVKITGVGFTDGLENDSVTQPGGLGYSSDFTITSPSFPVTVTNGATQTFSVQFLPMRSSQGYDVRSRILSFVNNAGLNLKVPVGGNVIEVGFDNCTTHPIMGLPANYSIADMDTGRHGGMYVDASSIALLTTVATATMGSYVSVGARGVQVLVYFQDISQGCDLDIYANTTGGDWHVGHFPGLTYSNVGGLFIGNNEGFDLQGLQLKAQVSNLLNSKTISVGVVVTG